MSADTANRALIADRHYGPMQGADCRAADYYPQTNYGAAYIKAIEFHDPKGLDQEFLYYPNGSVRNGFSLRPR